MRFVETALTRENYRAVLDGWLGNGDFLLNVSVDVSSVALIEFCQEKGALYLDTCIEPWPGGYTDPNLPPSARSNYALRESALALAAALSGRPDGGDHARRQSRAWCRISSSRRCSTSLATAEPAAEAPADRAGLGGLAERLGVKVIHIAERDTQVADAPEGARRVRQHLVDRRLCQRRLAAGRARLGHPRTAFPGRRRPP